MSKKTAAIIVPVTTNEPPPFGYVRNYYAELSALTCTFALFDFYSDFCDINPDGDIVSVVDALGKVTDPLTLRAGAKPARYVDDDGGGGDFSVGSVGAYCLYSCAQFPPAGGTGILAVVTPESAPSTSVIASLNPGATDANNLFQPTSSVFRSYGIGDAPIPLGRPTWVMQARSAASAFIATRAGVITDATPSAGPVSGLWIGNQWEPSDARGFKGKIHAILVLKAYPTSDDMEVITSWANSITR